MAFASGPKSRYFFVGLSDEDDASGCPPEKREETDYMAALAPMHLRFQGHTSLTLSELSVHASGLG